MLLLAIEELMLNLNPINKDGFDGLDQEVLGRIYRSIPETVKIGGKEFRFRVPKGFEICWTPPSGVSSGQQFVDIPLDGLVKSRQRPLEKVLERDDVMVKRESSADGWYDPENDSVCIFLGPLRGLATRAVDFFKNLDFEKAYYACVRKTILHELTHATFDHRTSIISNYRLSEGLANLIPNRLGSRLEIALNAVKCMYQDIRYNYQFLLSKSPAIGEIIASAADGKFNVADELFYNSVLGPNTHYKWESGARLRVRGDVKALYFGFGGKDIELFVGGALDPICNVRGKVAAASIKRIDGYLDPEKIRVVTNSPARGPCYNILKPKKDAVVPVKRSELNIAKEVNNDNFNFQDYLDTVPIYSA